MLPHRRVGKAERLRANKLRNELSSQIQRLLARSVEYQKLDQAIFNEVRPVASAIRRIKQEIRGDGSGDGKADKEGRALHLLLNQVEERIEFLAQQKIDEIITGKDCAPISKENTN